jgi:hypothetical protein
MAHRRWGRSNEEKQPVDYALQENDLESLEVLLSTGQNPASLNSQQHRAPLFAAAYHGDRGKVLNFIGNGNDPTAQYARIFESMGRNALEIAHRRGHLELAEEMRIAFLNRLGPSSGSAAPVLQSQLSAASPAPHLKRSSASVLSVNVNTLAAFLYTTPDSFDHARFRELLQKARSIINNPVDKDGKAHLSIAT